MTTSDRHEQGPLTRKQLREIRMTGSTPVITDDQAAAAAAATPPVPPLPREVPRDAKPAEPVEAEPVEAEPVVSEPVEAEAVEPSAVQPTEAEAEPAFVEAESARQTDADAGSAPLTRRQARTQERVRTESVPVIDPASDDSDAVLEEPAGSASSEREEPLVEDAVVEDVIPEPADGTRVDEPAATEVVVEEVPATEGADEREIVSGVPDFSSETSDAGDEDDDDGDDEVLVAPMSASHASTAEAEAPSEERSGAENVDDDASTEDDVDAALGLTPAEQVTDPDDVLADVDSADDDDIAADERPTVNPAFGQTVLAKEQKPFAPSFDELLTAGDSSGSQHSASSALIFTPSHGEGSLSGPVASTGEILVTGSYELPRGIGSQGHAHGVADGKDVDAVLIDGELAPASSPTPIAASAAVSTIKPAGEIIRPPAPEKGNKLMLILAIVAGGLALALGVALIVAFTTNVF